MSQVSRPRLVATVAAGLFLVHALNYICFFIDDEGIPFVYARNLLRGRGLVYSAIEGRVEGYSDFLQVVVDALILGATRLVHAPLLSVFIIGKLLSLAAGAALVWVVVRALAGWYRMTSVAAGATLMVLAGPIALWSCSSLEVALFALTFVGLVLALQRERWEAAASAAALLVLLRIDGPVYILAALIGYLLGAERGQRRLVLLRVGLPAVLVALLYHGWRRWYFGYWLSTPLEAKVLFKLTPHARVLTKLPSANYAVQFAELYGVVFLLLAGLGWVLLRRRRQAVGLAVTVALLVAYAATVGDWMFGFRLFVPTLALLALLSAETIDALAVRRPPLAGVACLASMLWLGHVATVFGAAYTEAQFKPSFLLNPSLDPARFFAPYWGVYDSLKDRIAPGTLIADNQAGFVPFMLDVDNIDDLGICSRFYAELPTRDVFFTEVGRFSPLSNLDVRTAGLAYLLNRNPAFIIERSDLLGALNAGVIPEELLGGHYRRIPMPTSQSSAAYERTSLTSDEFRTDASRFLENVAHVAHLARAAENGVDVPRKDYAGRLRFLHEGEAPVVVAETYTLQLLFDTGEVPVYEVHIERVRSPIPVEVTLDLWSAAGKVVNEQKLTLAPHELSALHVRLPAPVRAAQATLTIDAGRVPPDDATVLVGDVRIQAQPAALADYVKRRVPLAR